MDKTKLALIDARDAIEKLMARCATYGDVLGNARGRVALAMIATALEDMEAKKPTAAQLLSAPIEPPKDSAPSIRFVVATPPSSKNAQKMRVVPGGKKGLGIPIRYRPRDVIDATEAIQAAAVAALRKQAPKCFAERRPLIEDGDVSVQMVHNVANETLDVTVQLIGARPKGTTGRRRDVVNLPELVLDAIQRIAYRNDNQVCDLRVWRNVGTPTTNPGD
jgi:hypothetical protein